MFLFFVNLFYFKYSKYNYAPRAFYFNSKSHKTMEIK